MADLAGLKGQAIVAQVNALGPAACRGQQKQKSRNQKTEKAPPSHQATAPVISEGLVPRCLWFPDTSGVTACCRTSAAVLRSWQLLDTGGVTACSRWLSAATPPVSRARKTAPRQGCQPPSPWDNHIQGCFHTPHAGTPVGVHIVVESETGGVARGASLNHRLQAGTPPASDQRPPECYGSAPNHQSPDRRGAPAASVTGWLLCPDNC